MSTPPLAPAIPFEFLGGELNLGTSIPMPNSPGQANSFPNSPFNTPPPKYLQSLHPSPNRSGSLFGSPLRPSSKTPSILLTSPELPLTLISDGALNTQVAPPCTNFNCSEHSDDRMDLEKYLLKILIAGDETKLAKFKPDSICNECKRQNVVHKESNDRRMILHLWERHGIAGMLPCVACHCPTYFPNLPALRKHLFLKHYVPVQGLSQGLQPSSQNPIFCDRYCGRAFETQRELDDHLILHEGPPHELIEKHQVLLAAKQAESHRSNKRNRTDEDSYQESSSESDSSDSSETESDETESECHSEKESRPKPAMKRKPKKTSSPPAKRANSKRDIEFFKFPENLPSDDERQGVIFLIAIKQAMEKLKPNIWHDKKLVKAQVVKILERLQPKYDTKYFGSFMGSHIKNQGRFSFKKVDNFNAVKNERGIYLGWNLSGYENCSFSSGFMLVK